MRKPFYTGEIKDRYEKAEMAFFDRVGYNRLIPDVNLAKEWIEDIASEHNVNPYFLARWIEFAEAGLRIRVLTPDQRDEYLPQRPVRAPLLYEGVTVWKRYTAKRDKTLGKALYYFTEDNPDICDVPVDQPLPDSLEIIKRIREFAIEKGVDPRYLLTEIKARFFQGWNVINEDGACKYHKLHTLFDDRRNKTPNEYTCGNEGDSQMPIWSWKHEQRDGNEITVLDEGWINATDETQAKKQAVKLVKKSDKGTDVLDKWGIEWEFDDEIGEHVKKASLLQTNHGSPDPEAPSKKWSWEWIRLTQDVDNLIWMINRLAGLDTLSPFAQAFLKRFPMHKETPDSDQVLVWANPKWHRIKVQADRLCDAIALAKSYKG